MNKECRTNLKIGFATDSRINGGSRSNSFGNKRCPQVRLFGNFKKKKNNTKNVLFFGSILFDVGELRQHLFCIKKYRKDTLKSFRINLPNKFIGGFKM
ncbi:hypothetical protein EUZ95_07050, partial [Enterococcus durans]